MTKRKLGIAAAVLALIAALVVWRLHRGGSVDGKPAEAATQASPTAFAMGREARIDPRKLERASIAGTIRDEDRKPIANARVCADAETAKLSAELVRDPRCANSDEQGNYLIPELFAAEYRVAAMAKPYQPDVYHPDGDRDVELFELKAGEHKTGIDIKLDKGGAEITGVVADISGGAIAHARVRASSGRWWSGSAYPAIETDDTGKFSMWVRPGDLSVTANADGYAPGSDRGRAPGKLEILLTPESSLSGTVVDAKTGAAVAGVAVEVSTGEWGGWSDSSPGDLTDEAGKFRVTRLAPGRYISVARAPKGYGHSEGSTLVGLGQHVSGVVVKLYPAFQVSGRVVIPGEKRPTCKHSSMYLRQAVPERWMQATREPDGTLHVDGVLPGKYEVSADCDGFQSKDKYPPIEIKDKDLVGLEWEVDAGSILRGKVVTKSGAPVEGATVWAQSIGGAARDKTGWSSDTSQKDGSYRLKGLKQGTYKLELRTDKGAPPKEGYKVDVKAMTVDHDLVVDDVGTIKGSVVDAEGKPVAGVHVDARSLDGGWGWGGSTVRTNDDGTFALEGNRPGDYRVRAHRGEWSDELRKPGTNDDAKQGERVTVHPGQTAMVRIVVESQSGTIKGTCVDGGGKPVTDAFVSAARESDAAGNQRSSVGETRWSWDDKPVLTATDGTWAIPRLSPGSYTVRAYRKGGGEAVAEHVAVGTTAKLEFKPTGSIDGLVHRDGGAPEELDVDVRDEKTDFSRHEHFFRTSGHYTVKDLPAGHFTITAAAEHGQKQTTIDLADGDNKTGVDIELDPLVTITGRVVDVTTKQPVAGIQMAAEIGKSGGGMNFSSGDDERENVSDETGRFTIKNAPHGVVTVMGFPKDWSESDYGFVRTVAQANGNDTVDIGDVLVAKRRIKPTDQAGELGVHWVDQPDDTPIDQERYEISWIDPHGAAAKTDLKVGDVVTSIDGVDVTGGNHALGWTLMHAAPGTKMGLGLQRGATVTVVLAPPS
jgi:hypothetical protein